MMTLTVGTAPHQASIGWPLAGHSGIATALEISCDNRGAFGAVGGAWSN
jgi:hypothetical protein